MKLFLALLLGGAVALAPTPPQTQDRRQAIKAALFASAALPLTASAAVIPGLNAPGLVPAAKKSGAKPSFEDIRDKSQFWSSKGIMNSVPKVNGIITPKTPT